MPKITDRSVLTQKSQVTIPKTVREVLGVGPGDQVRFKVEGDVVSIEHVASDIESSYGAVKPKKRPEDLKRVRESVESAMARDVAARK